MRHIEPAGEVLQVRIHEPFSRLLYLLRDRLRWKLITRRNLVGRYGRGGGLRGLLGSLHSPDGWSSIAGTWRHQLKGSRVEVVVEPFVRTSAWIRRAAGFEAERLAAFLGGTLSFAWQR